MEFITITAVQPRKGTKYTVFTDSGDAPVVLDYEVIYIKGIKQDRKFTAEQWEEIVQSEMLRNARSTALYLLSIRDMSSGVLYKKLTEKGISDRIAAQTVSRCIELGEIDDMRYALKAARYCLITKRFGTSRAYPWMLQKGIPKEIAKEALQQIADEVDAVAQIRLVLEKKYAKKLATGELKDKQSTIAALARRGYRFGDIKRAIEEYEYDLEN